MKSTSLDNRASTVPDTVRTDSSVENDTVPVFPRRTEAASARTGAHIEPGREGLFALVKAAPSDMRYENALITANGDYVMLHGRFWNVGQPANWIVADIVRIEDGLLAEHWDVIQDEATREDPRAGCPRSKTNSPPRPEVAFG
jgi:hypothetical protein